jgi:hypothetical protein
MKYLGETLFLGGKVRGGNEKVLCWMFQGSRVPGFQGSRVPGFQGSRVSGFQGSRVPGFQGSRVPGF